MGNAVGNAVALKDFGGIEAARRYAAGLRSTANLVSAGDGKPMLKMDKDTGDWSFGQDNEPLQDGDLLAVNPLSFQQGWVAFNPKDNTIAEDLDGNRAEVLVPANQPMPNYDTLPELETFTDKRTKKELTPPWQPTLTVEMVVIEGPNAGAEIIFKTVSRGGMRMIQLLRDEVAMAIEDETVADERYVPVIELFSESYKHKTYGTIYNPIFEVIDWTDMTETLGAVQRGAAANEPDEAPQTTKPAAKQKAEPEKGRSRKQAARQPEPEPEGEDDDAPAIARTPRQAQENARGRGRGREEAAPEAPAAGRTRQTGRGRETDEAPAEEAPVVGRRSRNAPEPEAEVPARGGPRGSRAAGGGRSARNR